MRDFSEARHDSIASSKTQRVAGTANRVLELVGALMPVVTPTQRPVYEAGSIARAPGGSASKTQRELSRRRNQTFANSHSWWTL